MGLSVRPQFCLVCLFFSQQYHLAFISVSWQFVFIYCRSSLYHSFHYFNCGFLFIHINLRINVLSYSKSPPGIVIGITLNLQINLGENDIFIVLKSSDPRDEISLSLFKASSTSLELIHPLLPWRLFVFFTCFYIVYNFCCYCEIVFNFFKLYFRVGYYCQRGRAFFFFFFLGRALIQETGKYFFVTCNSSMNFFLGGQSYIQQIVEFFFLLLQLLHLISFSFFMVFLMTCSTMLNGNGGRSILVLFLILEIAPKISLSNMRCIIGFQCM